MGATGRYYQCMALRGGSRHGTGRSDVRFVMDHRPGQTRRESGTQSQGSSFGKTARLPESVAGMQTIEVVP
jgi:hypothetical protein